jgi:ureidoglycolate lyase
MEGAEKPGMVAPDGSIRDLSAHLPDLRDDALHPDRLAALRALDPATLPPVPADVRLGPCVASAGKIVAVGLNYADHARESGMALPAEAVLFMKACRLSGPADAIVIPAGSNRTDWEIELAVVIGQETFAVPEATALEHVAGYATFVDISERSWQLERGGQWVKGKSHPSFAPIGPWLVTADAIGDPQRLRLWLEVNGVRRQDSSTAEMAFGVRKLVSYISGFMVLYPGDVIATGTPPGVGMGLKPTPVYLADGDVIRCGVEGLGEQRHLCQAAARR